MPLPNVVTEFRDGGLGLASGESPGVHGKIGTAEKGTANEIVWLADYGAAVNAFGVGPLVDALEDSFACGASLIGACKVTSDQQGSVSAVTQTGTGLGDVTLSIAAAAGDGNENPTTSEHQQAKIITGGATGVASYRLSRDGGLTWGAEATTSAAEATGNGVNLNFDDTAGVFVAGDVYAWTTTAANASDAEILTGAGVFADDDTIRFLHLLGEQDAAFAASLSTTLAQFSADERPIFAVLEAVKQTAGQTIDQWIAALSDDWEYFSDSYISPVAGDLLLANNKGEQVTRSGAACYAGKLASADIQESVGALDFVIKQALALRPVGLTKAHIEVLDAARFVTFRRWPGYGIACTNARTMASPTSDLRYVETVRVVNECRRDVRTAGLPFLHKGMDESGLGALQGAAQARLNRRIPGQITAATVTIPEGQDFLGTGQVQVLVRITPIAIGREITFTVSLYNPALAAA